MILKVVTLRNTLLAGLIVLPSFISARQSTTDTLKTTPSTVKNLAVLGKVWGFLKYYHPAVARGDYNWDDELLRVLPAVRDCAGREERDRVLTQWITEMGALKSDKRAKRPKQGVTMLPDLGWIDSSGFERDLVFQLNEVRNAKREDEHFYLRLLPTYGGIRVNNEHPYPQMDYPDAGYRLLALYRYWNLVEYFFPYKYLIKDDWDQVLETYIPKFAAASNELEYTLTILSLITCIHDSHGGIWANETLNKYLGRRYAALELSFVENKPVVTGYFDRAAGVRTGLRPGDVIRRVDGKPVTELINQLSPLTPASNEHTRFRDIAGKLLRSNGKTMLLEYARGDSVYKARVATFSPDSIRPFKPYPDTAFTFLAPGIAYLHGGRVDASRLPAIWAGLQSVKGLVIDLRCMITPGYAFWYELGSYLLPRPVGFVKNSYASISSPGLFIVDDSVQVGSRKNKDHYKGKVVILVNERTQSAAEYHTMALAKAPRATVMGSNTAGADGGILPFSLPGNVETSFSGVGVYYPDGTETQRIGIVPDIIVKPSIQGLADGRDELLEAAVKLIGSAEPSAGAPR